MQSSCMPVLGSTIVLSLGEFNVLGRAVTISRLPARCRRCPQSCDQMPSHLPALRSTRGRHSRMLRWRDSGFDGGCHPPCWAAWLLTMGVGEVHRLYALKDCSIPYGSIVTTGEAVGEEDGLAEQRPLGGSECVPRVDQHAGRCATAFVYSACGSSLSRRALARLAARAPRTHGQPQGREPMAPICRRAESRRKVRWLSETNHASRSGPAETEVCGDGCCWMRRLPSFERRPRLRCLTMPSADVSHEPCALGWPREVGDNVARGTPRGSVFPRPAALAITVVTSPPPSPVVIRGCEGHVASCVLAGPRVTCCRASIRTMPPPPLRQEQQQQQQQTGPRADGESTINTIQYWPAGDGSAGRQQA